jgi:hypothetical protein
LQSAAFEITSAEFSRARYVYLAHYLQALVQASAWKDAEAAMAEIVSYIHDVGSRRTTTLLHEIVAAVLGSKAPPVLKDCARHLRTVLEGAGYWA